MEFPSPRSGVKTNTTMVCWDKEGTLLTVDENFQEIFGWTQNEVLGKKIMDVILAAPYSTSFPSFLESFLSCGLPKLTGCIWEVDAVNKQGICFQINLSAIISGEEGNLLFVSQLERIRKESCRFSFDMYGSIINGCDQGFFGYNQLQGLKFQTLIPSMPPFPSENRTSNYLYLKDSVTPKGITLAAIKRDGTRFPVSFYIDSTNVMDQTIFTASFLKINLSREVLFIVSQEDIILEVNSRVSVVFGYLPDEIIGKNISIVLGLAKATEQKEVDEDFESHPKRQKLVLKWCQLPMMEPSTLEMREKDGRSLKTTCTIVPLHDHKYAFRVRRVDEEIRDNTIGKYLIGEVIAEGSFGTVHKAVCLGTKVEAAVKILELSQGASMKLEELRARREIEILTKLHHPNIIKLFDTVVTQTKFFIFMEYVTCEGVGGFTLRDLLQKDLTLEETRYIFCQIVTAIQYCHDQMVVHRDLKPSNVLIADNNQVKLIDFGVSAVYELGVLQSTFCGSPAYAAPEIISGTKYEGAPADIWSLGVLLYRMISGNLPFDSVGKLLNDTFNPIDTTQEVQELLSLMLVKDPERRATIQQIAIHPWVNIEQPRVELRPQQVVKRATQPPSPPPPMAPIVTLSNRDIGDLLKRFKAR